VSTRTRGAGQDLSAAVGDVLPAVEALRVPGQQPLDAVAGALGHFGQVDPGVEQRRRRRVLITLRRPEFSRREW
jgi:hypothetical protein